MFGRKSNTKYIISELSKCQEIEEQLSILNKYLEGPKFQTFFDAQKKAEAFCKKIPYMNRDKTVTFIRPVTDGFMLFTGGKMTGEEAMQILDALRNSRSS